MAAKTTDTTTYAPATIYQFRLMRPVRIAGGRYDCADLHEAAGALLDAIIEQEGADAIDTATAIE